MATNNPRQRWTQAYRAARAAYLLLNIYRHRFPENALPRFYLDAANACPGYCPTRLFPDRLAFCADVLPLRQRHEGRMLHLKSRVRLPA